MDKVLVVKNLEKYQHYKDRHMVWFKWNIDCLNDYAFSVLSDSAKWVFIGMVCLACKCDNRIPHDISWITKQISTSSSVEKDIEILIASGLLASCYQNAIPIREEKIREDKKGATSKVLADDVFLAQLKTTYAHADIETEFKKMDMWLSTHPGRKKTHRFIINWLNKVEKPVDIKFKPRVKDTRPEWMKDAMKKGAI